MAHVRRRRKYASGRKAKAIDDRTGFKVNYRDLKKEWNGLWVHKDEWEAKHPQLRPRSAVDAQILHHARPDNDDAGVRVSGLNFNGVEINVLIGNVTVSIA